MYYASLLRYCHPVMILVRIDHPFLRVGCHRWYQSHYGYNTLRTVLFPKTVVRIHLDAHIRTIVVLIGGKLTGIYFLQRRTYAKVSILPLGDVNPRPVLSRWDLLEDSLYHMVGATVCCAMSHDYTPRLCGDLGISCGHFRKTWMRSCNVCSVVHWALTAWVLIGG
jgi:hypothetical protein